MTEQAPLSVARGASLYVAAVIGPGLLFIPFLAVETSGPAAVIAWGALLLVSVPIVVTFSALSVRYPTAGGVAAYAREAFGDAAAAAIGACFLAEVAFGVAAVASIGGRYIAVLTAPHVEELPVAAALSMYTVVVLASLGGLRVSGAIQLVLSALLIAALVAATVAIVPTRSGRNWTPFAPHGWWAIGSAANLLIWLFFGWEAMAQLAGAFRQPRDLRHAVVVAFVVVTALYASFAVASVVAPSRGAQAPLAELISTGFGRAGRDVTVIVAAALTFGTINVYTSGATRLAASLARSGSLPRWFGGDADRDIPQRPLLALAVATTSLLLGLAFNLVGLETLVRATSACLIAVYLLALASAVKLLDGRLQLAAAISLLIMAAIAAFSASELAVPGLAALAAVALRRSRAIFGSLTRHAHPAAASRMHPASTPRGQRRLTPWRRLVRASLRRARSPRARV